MIKAALLALGCFVGASAPAAPTPSRSAADVAIEQATAIYDMTDPYDVYVDIRWIPCGQANAFYRISSGLITLCMEMADTPGAVFAAAHEAGHAMVFQLGLPVDLKDPYAHESAADELAALYLARSGQYDALVGGAQWFMSMGIEDDWDDGEHASNRERAWKLLCLADGAENGTRAVPACQVLYQVTKVYWAARLSRHG